MFRASKLEDHMKLITHQALATSSLADLRALLSDAFNALVRTTGETAEPQRSDGKLLLLVQDRADREDGLPNEGGRPTRG